MAHEEDVEKAQLGSGSSTSDSTVTAIGSRDTRPPLMQSITNHSRRSNMSARQRRLDGTDPYENLEHALSHSPTREDITPYGVNNDDDDDDDDYENYLNASAGDGQNPIEPTHSIATSVASRHPDFEVIFEVRDPENPKNWPIWYRVWVLFSIGMTCLIVVLFSTTYTASIPGLVEDFGTSTTVATLGLTTYLLGLAAGSVVLAPLSELYGRRPVYMVSLIAWALLVIPSGVTTTFITILVTRFFCAFFGAVMIANSPGSVVDIANPDYLAFTLSMWSIAPMNAPSLGGIIGGFVFEYLGWRWGNWIILIAGGVAILMMATCKETYAPIVLRRKAARLRKETDDERWWCVYEEGVSATKLLKTNMSRPFVLAFTEPILWFMNMWVSLVYGVLYLCFVAYPIVFRENRGWSPGMTGLSFVGIGTGTMIAILSEPLIRRIINRQPKDPETGKVPPEATAFIMAIGSILTPLGQLVFSWTCLPTSIHWAIPIAFGIPFGIGNTLCFIYGSNYLAGAYGIYSASALAGNAVIRSIFGGVLPLAGPKMYQTLTPQWAGTLLGLMEVAMIPIPFVLWRYGSKIRDKSRMIQQLREDQERIDAKRERNRLKMERQAARQRQEQEQEKKGMASPPIQEADEGEEKTR